MARLLEASGMTKRMRLIICLALLLTLVSIITLLGCSGESASTNEPAQEEAKEESAEAAKDAGNEVKLDAQSFKGALPTGDMKLPEIKEPTEMSDDEVQSAERAIRAYTPSSSDILTKNNAKSFYYYERLSGDAQFLYDGLMTLLEDPTVADQYIAVTLNAGASKDAVVDDFILARYALQYDHPEFFWIYNGVKTDVEAGFSKDGKKFYMALSKPYRGYKRDMKAFNKAVDAFLADIDTSQSDAEIAKAIHDKLMSMASYDDAVMEENKAIDLAHTAYGALVANSDGEKNKAVCDGYSQAYVYLLQQCGVDAAVILGYAGETKAAAGGHAWSVVNLDNDWYEVDVTWDDNNSTEVWRTALDDAKASDPSNKNLPYFETMISDATYMEKVEHYLFNLTTSEIESYTAPDGLYYHFEDGATGCLASDNVHIREEDYPDGYEPMAMLMELAPDAQGTLYAYAY